MVIRYTSFWLRKAYSPPHLNALANLADVTPVRTTETQGLQRFTANSRLWLLVVGALGVLGAWPGADFGPRTGLDAGWQLGINLASSIGLDHGTDVMWTYGPLGPLVHPLALDAHMVVSSLVTWFLVHLLLLTSITILLRPALGPYSSLLLAVFLVLAFPEQHVSERWSIALIAYVWLYARHLLRGVVRGLTPFALGIATALLACTKASSSLPVLVISAVALWWLGNWKVVSTFFVSGAIALVGVWLITGNGIPSLLPYLVGSVELTTGFSQAMSTSASPAYPERFLFDYVSLIALTSIILGVWWDRRKSEESWWLLTMLAAFGVWHWFRYSYIRPDGRHAIVFWFLALMASLLLFRERRQIRTGIAVVAVCIALAMGLTGRSLIQSLDPSEGVANFSQHFLMAVSSSARRGRLAEAQVASKEVFAIPDELVEILGDAPGVHVDSYATTAVWTYEMEWSPVPVIQSYSAYSPGLDARNARFLASSPAGHAILRRDEPSIGRRFRRFDSPEYATAMACLYVHEVTTAGWQVLLKGENRCGSARYIGSVTVENNDQVQIPAVTESGSMMTARINLGRSVLYEIHRVAFRPRDAEVLLDGDVYQFIRGTSGGPLILSFPEHPSFALGHLQHDGPASFDTIGLSGLYSDAIIEFWEVPVDLG